MSYFVIPAFRTREFFSYVSIFGIIFFLLGIALIFLTIREKIKGLLKKFLILTGASAAFLVGVIGSIVMFIKTRKLKNL